MPLRDHFHPPLNRHPWRWPTIHSGWAVYTANLLNQLLPPPYIAGQTIHIGSLAQVDVGSLKEKAAEEEERGETATNGGVATAVWAPPRPTRILAVHFAELDVVEVQVYQSEEGTQLVAAIELISPGNKDRPGAREAFVTKCAALLQQNVSVIIVDTVTERTDNLHGELLARLGENRDKNGATAADLYAVSYRPLSNATGGEVQIWEHVLELGQPLPTVPLWLPNNLAIPLDLEASYEQACHSVRVPGS